MSNLRSLRNLAAHGSTHARNSWRVENLAAPLLIVCTDIGEDKKQEAANG